MIQLPSDCLEEIFEHLEQDRNTLYSCLLVNRLWCESSVRILWRDIWKFTNITNTILRQRISNKIFNILIKFLSNETKEKLLKNEILIPNIKTKKPIFNYPSYCKVISIREIIQIIISNKKLYKTKNNIKEKYLLITKEIIKIFIKEITTLNKLIYYWEEKDYWDWNNYYNRNIPIIKKLSGGGNEIKCLKDLTELRCSTNIASELFYQLSKISYNIKLISIDYNNEISNGLKELIYVQQNLKNFYITSRGSSGDINYENITNSLTKHINNLNKLKICGKKNEGPLPPINKFINLKEINLLFFKDDKLLKIIYQQINYIQLQILKLSFKSLQVDLLIKFLENNGKNLIQLYISYHDNTYDPLNLSIAKFCPNLKSLHSPFIKNEIETLKIIFINCKKLESINILCGSLYLKENELLNIISKNSSKNFHELKLRYCLDSNILLKDLESFFIDWMNRVPQRSLLFIITKGHQNIISLEDKKENFELIEKYQKLGIIKFKKYDNEEFIYYDNNYYYRKEEIFF
ncbi:hypothetical protein RhiirA4_463822 [Rhizophagus irregularis]|uniref:F-box domain-containing protein n=1 Tax=Rhizophagus irregularis TaxID=588596 RepID=A0A2I1GNV5_9GLOM|nr:hypothetical protein RhiirA4_463822 [Rhizophagus irregularis]